MIKRIHKIKNFGVFQDYRNDSSLKDFDEKNIIYGWNYSGKTTISRLVSFLDKDAVLEPEYSNIEFDVELNDNSHITQTNRISSPVLVKVFNSDFIRNNLHFDTDEKMQGIKFMVGDGVVIQRQIQSIRTYVDRAESIVNNNQDNTREFSNFEPKFTSKARDIENILSLGRSFTKASIRQLISNWGADIESHQITNQAELDSVRIKAISQRNGSIIDINSPSTGYLGLYSQVVSVLQMQPTISNDDELLSSNNELYNWAKTGLDIYNKNPHIDKCAFCGSPITKEGRLEELNRYYSNEAAKVKSLIESLKRDIENEKKKFQTLEWSLKSENDIVPNYRESFLNYKARYRTICDKYVSLLDVLCGKLDVKISTSLFVSVDIGVVDDSANKEMINWIEDVKKIFEQSNAVFLDYETIHQQAIEKYKEHLVADFLISERYREIEIKKNIEERRNAKLRTAILSKQNEIKVLEAQLDSLEQGRDEMNKFISQFLNRTDLRIETTPDNCFILKRGTQIAKHLSDGEKTAIAFSHFMVVLTSLKQQNKLKDYVVFIDDPISSLDSNHIAQVYSLICNFFIQRGLDPSQPDKKCLCTKQLFISTHNFDFYSFINKATVLGKNKHCAQFFVEKKSQDLSTIINMPLPFKNYNSEYIFLFGEIKKAKDKKDALLPGDSFPTDGYYMLPNVIRRFLEIYTLLVGGIN